MSGQIFAFPNVHVLQREVEARLLEQLDYLDDKVPARVLDVGSGDAHASVAMKQRWPKAQVIALDIAVGELRQSRKQAGIFKSLLGRDIERIGADLRALPLADASIDVLFSNLCLHLVDDVHAALAEFRRVLKPDGMLLVSGFGCENLHIALLGDALMHAGFRNPVLDRDEFEVDGEGEAAWYEVVYAHAWAPQPGAPIRQGGHDVVAVPVARIPIRRKQ